MSKMLTTKPCAIYSEILDDFIDHNLTEDERVRVESHLNACPNCRDYVAVSKNVKNALQSHPSLKPPANPYLYAQIMDQIESIPSRRPNHGVKVAFAGVLALLIGLVSLFPVINEKPNPLYVPASKNVVTLVPGASFLVDNLDLSDILNFWHREAIPVDEARTEFVWLEKRFDGTANIFITGPDGHTYSNDLFGEVVRECNLSDEATAKIASILSDAAEEIQSGLVIRSNGDLLIDPDLYNVKETLHFKLAEVLQASEWQKFNSMIIKHLGVGHLGNMQGGITLSIPQKADLVKVNPADEKGMVLIQVDDFTLRGLTRSVARISRVVTIDSERNSSFNYEYVAQNTKWAVPQLPAVSDQVYEVLVATSSSDQPAALSISEANQYMNALKSGGLTTESILTQKAVLDDAFQEHLKTIQDLQIHLKKQMEYQRMTGFPSQSTVVVGGTGSTGDSILPQRKSRTLELNSKND